MFHRSYEPQPSDFLASDLPNEPMLRTVDVQSNLDLIMPCIRSIILQAITISSEIFDKTKIWSLLY